MRKRVIQQDTQGTSPDDEQDWLDVEDLVQVELTSEDAEYPIESALIMSAGSGWRAQHPGRQTIRLLFDRPQSCLLYTSPSPRDGLLSRMPSSA